MPKSTKLGGPKKAPAAKKEEQIDSGIKFFNQSEETKVSSQIDSSSTPIP